MGNQKNQKITLCDLTYLTLNSREPDDGLCREKFHEVPLGSGEKSYALNDVDGKGLYVKLKINRDRREEVWVLSFHVSIHHGR